MIGRVLASVNALTIVAWVLPRCFRRELKKVNGEVWCASYFMHLTCLIGEVFPSDGHLWQIKDHA